MPVREGVSTGLVVALVVALVIMPGRGGPRGHRPGRVGPWRAGRQYPANILVENGSHLRRVRDRGLHHDVPTRLWKVTQRAENLADCRHFLTWNAP